MLEFALGLGAGSSALDVAGGRSLVEEEEPEPEPEDDEDEERKP